MNPKHEIYCQQYVADFDQTAAAIRAGYSEKTARQYAVQLMRRPDVKARIEELKHEISQRAQVPPDVILARRDQLAMGNLYQVLRPHPNDPEQYALKPFNKLTEEDVAILDAIDIRTTEDLNKEGEVIGVTTHVKLKRHNPTPHLIDALKRRGMGDGPKKTLDDDERKMLDRYAERRYKQLHPGE